MNNRRHFAGGLRRWLCRLIPVFAVTVSAAAEPPPPAVETMATAGNVFACDLYARLKDKPGNLVFSPAGIATALAMVQGGANGDTATQMAQALRFPFPAKETHAAHGALLARLNSAQKTESLRLNIANSLWPQQGHPFRADYLALLRDAYEATVTPVDYKGAEPAARAKINQWVSDKTQEKIKNILPVPLPASTRLMILNAVYFKGLWETQFKKEGTADAPFFLSTGQTVTVPLMTQKARFSHGKADGVQFVALPYKGGTFSMLVLLPDAKTPEALEALERDLTTENLTKWRALMRKQDVKLSLPRFTITWGAYSLVPELTALGMGGAFRGDADFSGMDGTRELYISDVVHKAFVEVNEEGTEAAAVTIVGLRATRMPLPPPVFRADHPFIFLIQENATEHILFMGRVANPKPGKE